MDLEHPEFLLFLKCARQHNLKYLCIGGYAVNFHGFHRATDDMDIWIEPTNENRDAFCNTLLCMRFSEDEIAYIRGEDFRTYFMITIGQRPYVIDVLTIIHKDLNFSDAYAHRTTHLVADAVDMDLVPLHYLREMKLRSNRPKDLWDIARLEELRNKK